MPSTNDLKTFLEEQVDIYNRPAFIDEDPISIPHRYSRKQDVEIAGFFAAILAWGQRKTIIRKTGQLMDLMENKPYLFIRQSDRSDWARFEKFVHRTFQPTDLLYFLEFFKDFYASNTSFETAFIPGSREDYSLEKRLIHFRKLFFSLPFAPDRTGKHIASPSRNSTCKRLNMYLRWMVRQDDCGVDFGIWKNIPPASLHIPLDVHVERVARRLGLLKRKQRDWKAVVELTGRLRRFDPKDPAKYDFALFSLSASERRLNGF